MSVLTGKTIFVTGANGFLGKHVCKKLQGHGANIERNTADLRYVENHEIADSPDLMIHLAADVKGIAPNRALPMRFLTVNTLMTMNVIEMARQNAIPIVAAGSVCAYPENAPLPFNETDFWNGKPDSNNLGYGIAKRFLAGALECAAQQFGLRYVHLISANLYGPGDHFDDVGGHVIPTLIRRFHIAKGGGISPVRIWGTGQATRDFLYVEDAARAYVAAAESLLEGHFNTLECNIGSGNEIKIENVVGTIAHLIGYKGEIAFDPSMPDGQMRRIVDSNKAEHFLDWFATTSLLNGLKQTVEWYKENIER